MASHKRILRHLLFWLVYFLIFLYNELYLGWTFTHDPSMVWIWKGALSQSLSLLIKVPAVYFFLYVLLPRWFKSNARWKVVGFGVLAILLITVLMRLNTQLVVWPLIYNEPTREITIFQQIARGFYSMFELLQVVGLAVSIKLIGMRIRNLRREKELVREKLESEMRHLQSQLNPHFLFNSLNSIYALARAGNKHTADTVMRLSNILRYVIYETKKGRVPVGDELRVARAYIDLQQVRFGERIEMELEEDLDNLQQEVVPLLLLPLLENVYKHGVGGLSGKVQLHCQVKLAEGRLWITTKNPIGEAFPSEPEHKGIGLSNLRRQLELQYQEFTLEARPEGKYFIVQLYLNLGSHAGIELFDR